MRLLFGSLFACAWLLACSDDASPEAPPQTSPGAGAAGAVGGKAGGGASAGGFSAGKAGSAGTAGAAAWQSGGHAGTSSAAGHDSGGQGGSSQGGQGGSGASAGDVGVAGGGAGASGSEAAGASGGPGGDAGSAGSGGEAASGGAGGAGGSQGGGAGASSAGAGGKAGSGGAAGSTAGQGGSAGSAGKGGAAGFPGKTPGAEIGSGLSSAFEPSGAAWHPTLKQVFLCGDNSKIARMNIDGSDTKEWSVQGNWEGIAVADPASNFVYVVHEGSAKVTEFDFVLSKPGRVFNLEAAPPAAGIAPLTAADIDAMKDNGDKAGIEAMTFVPDANDPEGGLFWVGSQENGRVYRFRLSLSGGTGVTYLGSLKTWSISGMRGLEYDWIHGNRVFGIGNGKMFAVTRDGELLKEYTGVPGGDAEGVAYDGASLFIAEDSAATSDVWRYLSGSF